MAIELVTGYRGQIHVTAAQDADLQRGMFGGSCRLEVGNQMEAEIVTANEVRIMDGVCICDGREFYIGYGDTAVVNISSGTTAMRRNDLICIEYERDKNTGVETGSLVVVEGTPGDTATDPSITDNDIRTGVFTSQKALARVRINGVNIEGIDMLIDVVNSITTSADADVRDEMFNHEYEGVDLTKKFADEIAGFEDEWTWIQNRIDTGNFSGIRNEDYIPMTLATGETHEMQANIKTYYRSTDNELGYCIDWISRDCYSETVQWNTTNNNNGNAENAAPFMVSNVHDYLNNTLWPLVPDKVQKHVVQKRFLCETRYSSSGSLTDSTSWAWNDIGYLWIPSEFEVFGSIVCGTKPYSAGQAVQYPVFEGGWNRKTKGAGPGGARCAWWLMSVASGSATSACLVSANGYANAGSASYEDRVSICFRMAQAA